MGALGTRGAPLGVCGSHEGAVVTLTQMGKPTLTKLKYFKHSQDVGEGGVTGQSQPRRRPGSHEGHLRPGGLRSAEASAPMRTQTSTSGCRAGAGVTDVSGSAQCVHLAREKHEFRGAEVDSSDGGGRPQTLPQEPSSQWDGIEEAGL